MPDSRNAHWSGHLINVNYGEIILRDAQAHKQLALSNVDLHVLSCMLKLGEYIPASPECRKNLTKARRSQLNEVSYIHRLISVGSSENYLCDQLLKFRTGENVLALLAASVPIMTEEACIALISNLFECTGALPENIPGRVQLENFRTALVALSRRSGFAEKTANYHSLFTRVFRGTDHIPQCDPYQSIPGVIEMAKFIKNMYKVVTSEEQYVVIWKGIRGAAWAAAYATYVLGLDVCVLDPKMNPVPITSSYADAKLLVELHDVSCACELYLQGEVKEIIDMSSSTPSSRQGWSIDCKILDLVDLSHPGMKQRSDFGRLSTFAAIELYNKLWAASSYFEQWTPDVLYYRNYAAGGSRLSENRRLGFKTYIKSVMRELFGRALIVLRDLGFRPAMTGYDFSEDGDSCVGHESDPKVTYEFVETGGDEHEVEFAGITRKVRGKSRTTQVENRTGRWLPKVWNWTDLDRVENYLRGKSPQASGHDANTPSRGHQFGNVSLDGNARAHLGDVHHHYNDTSIAELSKDSRLALIETMKLAIHISSRLAFTDWHHSVQMLSMTILSPNFRMETPDERQFEGLVAETVSFCFDGIDSRALEMRLWSEDWVVLDLDGFVVLRTVAITPDINSIRGKLISFANGRIQFEDSHYKKVRNDRSTASSIYNFPDQRERVNAYLDIERASRPIFRFRNKFPDTRLRSLVTASGDTIFLRTEVYLCNEEPIFVDGTKSARLLYNLLISDPCPHGYRSEYKMSNFFDHRQYIGRVFEGFYTNDVRGQGLVIDPSFSTCPLYIQHTKDNSKLQWLALQWQPTTDPERCLVVLQKDCCIDCLLSRLGAIIESLRQSNLPVMAGGYPICIIAGDDPNGRLKTSSHRERKSEGSTGMRDVHLTLPSRHTRSASADTPPARSQPSPVHSLSSNSSAPRVNETSEVMPRYFSSVKRKPVPSPESRTRNL